MLYLLALSAKQGDLLEATGMFYLRCTKSNKEILLSSFPGFHSSLPYLSPKDLISEVNDSAPFDMRGGYINHFFCRWK